MWRGYSFSMRKVVYGVLGAVIVGTALIYAALALEQSTSGVLEGYTRNSYHIYVLGPEKEIHGSSYTIPASLAEGTNLSTDTYISYEELPNAAKCDPTEFLDSEPEVGEVVDDGVTYLVAHSIGAAAGNRYDETVYVFKDYQPCNAVRYCIHYGNIENYPPEAVQEFDSAALIAEFDSIRRMLAQSR